MGVARFLSRIRLATLAVLIASVAALPAKASPTCPDERETEQVPTDPAKCAELAAYVRKPSAYGLDFYEKKMHAFLEAKCHRDEKGGWKHDKYVRDAGPFIGTLKRGGWDGTYFGTHAPVLIWYSPEMYAWIKANRDEKTVHTGGTDTSVDEPPVPDGAIMVKEMYKAPASACAKIEWKYLLPVKSGAAIMVRDSKGSWDGWFWGWYGWDAKPADLTVNSPRGSPLLAPVGAAWRALGFEADSQWKSDYDNAVASPYPNMGFGQYCTNCHASAKHNSTFSALKNIAGEEGTPLVFLSQNFFLDPSWDSLHSRMQMAGDADKEAAGRDPEYLPAFVKRFGIPDGPPGRKDFTDLAPSTFDSVWAMPGKATPAGQYLTSDQCIGCHSAGGTGLQYDMTEPGEGDKLVNISPYGTWRGSPMGLSGRDPIFFAQLASETETFHPKMKSKVEDTCLGCHGVLGQRQHAIDTRQASGKCEPFGLAMLDAIPSTSQAPDPPKVHWAALGRDGISCTSCHHMILSKADKAKHENEPQNACVKERQAALNPGLTGFASTFTGSFLVGAPGDLYGPFKQPKKKPMQHAVGLEAVHRQSVTSSEMCGSCHTVHLPILDGTKEVGHVYEQTTYPEWAFSDFRTGDSPDGPMPYGSGPQAQSCQGCHMPNKDKYANAYRSKIASIQEYSNFPQAENALPPKEIDLSMRDGFAKHTLVGLNVFLLKMAWQFPDILGVRKSDPMLAPKGVDAIPTAEAAMLEQANTRTATVGVADIVQDNGELSARVTVSSKVGHKFPSGVGFRRAFIEFDVLDVDGKVIWASGRTDETGIIVGADKQPIKGELWWSPDCTRLPAVDNQEHQPHYEEIRAQDQAQIYQELVAGAPKGQSASAAVCGPHATSSGPLTTSFLSICSKVKDNRILPQGFMGLDERRKIAAALGADDLMAEEAGATGVGADKDYAKGGGDSLVYRVPMAELKGRTPAAVQATLYYQAVPPFFLQDRFCTSKGAEAKRLYYLAGKLSLDSRAQSWKLRVTTSGQVTVP